MHQFLHNNRRSNSTPVPGPLPAVVTVDADPSNLFPREYHSIKKKSSGSGGSSTVQRVIQKAAQGWPWKPTPPTTPIIEAAPPDLHEVEAIELQTSPPDLRRVETVERAAAARIYFETYYSEVLNGETPRECRLRQYQRNLDKALPPLSHFNRVREMQSFYQEETNHLREERVTKAQSCRMTWSSWSTKPQQIQKLGVPRYSYLEDLETLQILGKGSFGVVKLVRERFGPQVYAMKVIRKSDMIRSCQEGHLRAERDFLVAASNSDWIVPLICSFQDSTNLYLVMDYMPGGDFLGLLIRENILSESRTRFYIAEMILCVEEAHNLGCIHRDVKPNNFLIGADGHLKISDFGLAFDDHWSHDTAYYKWQRQALLSSNNITLSGDSEDQKGSQEGGQAKRNGLVRRHEPPANKIKSRGLPKGLPRLRTVDHVAQLHISETPLTVDDLLDWRAMITRRSCALSVVGTSQYMAPEVVMGERYDGRCDWWSIGIILYECLYGHTPFLSDKGRQYTKKNIVNHKETLVFPSEPPVSEACRDLIKSLLQVKHKRLSSPYYRYQDAHYIPFNTDGYVGRYVFSNDATDIKRHPWFRGVAWSEMRWREPEWLPQIRDHLDTHYFEEDDPISDWSESVDYPAEVELANERQVLKELRSVGFTDRHIRFFLDVIKQPYDSTRLKQIDRDIDDYSRLSSEGKQCMKELIRKYGVKERKRPRDKLLRDPTTKDAVMRLRKQTAFLGYSWRKANHMHRLPLTGVYDTDACVMAPHGQIVSYDMGLQGVPPMPPPCGW